MTSESGPPGGRRARGRFALFAFGSFLTGLGLVAMISLSGLLDLVGDYRQELYILPGIIGGAIAWGLGGALLTRYLRRPLLPAVVLAAVGLLLLTWGDLAFPVVDDLDLFLRSFLCTIIGLPVAVSVVEGCARDLRRPRSLLWGVGLGLGPLIMGILYSLGYAELGFEDFSYLVLGTELAAAPIVALYVLWALRKPRLSEKGKGGASSMELRGTKETTPPDAEGPATAAAPLSWRPGPRRLPPPSSVRRVPLLAMALLLATVMATPATLAERAPVTGALVGPEARVEVGPTRTPIQHVIMIMMENHAFDNYFGTYPDSSETGSPVPGLPGPENLLNVSQPWPVSEVPNGTWNTVDPVEGYSPYHIDWDGGKLDHFAEGSGPQSLTYFTSDQLAPVWDWAEEYALGQNYFATELTETTPNRLWTLAGYSPVMNDYGPPPYIPMDQTIFGELNSYGVPWGYYVSNPSLGLGTLDFIEGADSQSGVGTWSDFSSELSSGTLPPVTWLQPVDGGEEDTYSQGPPGNLLEGDMWLLYYLDEIMESPLWSSTAVLITWDEGGGYYDQVDPPVLDGEQLGQRVPFLVISPYAKEAYVSGTLLNHDSQIAFVEYNWGLPALNSFVAQSGLPLDFFDFSGAPRAPYPFTAAQGFPVSVSPPPPDGYPLPSVDLAPLFPMPLQTPLLERGYGSYGSVAVDLQSLGAGTFVSQDGAYTPWYVSPALLAGLMVAELAFFAVATRVAFPGPSRERSPR